MSSKTYFLSFDDWAKFQGLPLEKDENGLYIDRHTHYARKGWEAKPEKHEVDELQKRIDMAIEHIEDYYGVVGLSMVVDILNGEETK